MKRWNKKILTVMLEWDYGIEARGPSGEQLWFYDNLKELTTEVVPFWYDSYLNRMNDLQDAVLSKASQEQPDLIFFVPYKDQFTNVMLLSLKSSFKTVAWFGDDHWRFDSFTKNYAPVYEVCITTDPLSVSKYLQLGINPILSDWAAQPLSSHRVEWKDHTYDYNITFVGGYNEVRGWFIKELAKRGIAVDCFGAGWPNGRITYERMYDIFMKSKINLNLSNSVTNDIRFVFGGLKNFARWIKSKKTSEQVKARNFEIPLAGGFQLTNYVFGLERHWEIGKEIAIYSSPDECAKQIEYYLNNDAERKLVVERSYERATNEHTYTKRLEKILEEIWPEKT